MKLMRRNLSPVWYCLYGGKQAVLDDEGYETGEYGVVYDDPVEMLCSVSSATGQAQVNVFGNLDNYDKVIVTDDMSCPIDENTVLYVDTSPADGGEYDYIVKRVAKSLNCISIAISKVKVS